MSRSMESLQSLGMVLMTEDEMFFGLTSSASRGESPGSRYVQ